MNIKPTMILALILRNYFYGKNWVKNSHACRPEPGNCYSRWVHNFLQSLVLDMKLQFFPEPPEEVIAPDPERGAGREKY